MTGKQTADAAHGEPSATVIEYGKLDPKSGQLGGKRPVKRRTHPRGWAAMLKALERIVRKNTSYIDLYVAPAGARASQARECEEDVRIYYRGHMVRADAETEEIWRSWPAHQKTPGRSWRLENVPFRDGDVADYPEKPVMTAAQVLGYAIHAAGYRGHEHAIDPDADGEDEDKRSNEHGEAEDDGGNEPSLNEIVAATIACVNAYRQPGTSFTADSGEGNERVRVVANPAADEHDVVEFDIHRTNGASDCIGMQGLTEPTTAEWVEVVRSILRQDRGNGNATDRSQEANRRDWLRDELTAELTRPGPVRTFVLSHEGETVEVYYRGEGNEGPDWRIGGHKQYGPIETIIGRAWAMLTGTDDGGDDAPVKVTYESIPTNLNVEIIDPAESDRPE